MKTVTSIFLTTLLSIVLLNQTGNAQCIYCNSNTIGDSSSAIGAENISTGAYSLASGFQNEATGKFSFAGGEESVASQKWAFAYGERAIANGFRSFAQGMDVVAFGGNSVAIGRYVKTNTSDAMVIGYGVDIDNYLTNSINGSLMIGFNSDIPTFFIESASGAGTFGKVGIGTSDPSKMLEVNGTFKVNQGSYMSTINLDDSDIRYINQLSGNDGLKFKGKTLLTNTQMILTEEGKLGIGVDAPDAKLQVNGNIFIDDANSGLILKSPDGQCWKGTIDDNGSFTFENIDCNLVTGNNEDSGISQQQTAHIFPNPAGNKIYIEIPVGLQQTYMALYNEQGILLQSKDLQEGRNAVSLKKIQSGIIVVKIFNVTGELVSTEKVMHR